MKNNRNINALTEIFPSSLYAYIIATKVGLFWMYQEWYLKLWTLLSVLFNSYSISVRHLYILALLDWNDSKRTVYNITMLNCLDKYIDKSLTIYK